MNLSIKQKQTPRLREQICGCQEITSVDEDGEKRKPSHTAKRIFSSSSLTKVPKWTLLIPAQIS